MSYINFRTTNETISVGAGKNEIYSPHAWFAALVMVLPHCIDLHRLSFDECESKIVPWLECAVANSCR